MYKIYRAELLKLSFQTIKNILLEEIFVFDKHVKFIVFTMLIMLNDLILGKKSSEIKHLTARSKHFNLSSGNLKILHGPTDAHKS